MSDTALAVVHEEGTALSVDTVVHRLDKIQELMKRAMHLGTDFGVIPGTKGKPTLLKPGAEKLCVMFRLAPEYKTTKTFSPDGHLLVESTCRLLDLHGGFLGEASAMCSTREAKYAWRTADRTCPNCGQPNIRKSKQGGGWYCWAKTGGCGENFNADDPEITGQQTGRMPNPDLADTYNTVLRIAEKRSLIGAVRLVTSSSALFDEESHEHDAEPQPRPARPAAPPPVSPLVAQAVDDWRQFLGHEQPPLEEFNHRLPEIANVPEAKAQIWALCKEYAERRGWKWNAPARRFVSEAPEGPPPMVDEPLPVPEAEVLDREPGVEPPEDEEPKQSRRRKAGAA